MFYNRRLPYPHKNRNFVSTLASKLRHQQAKIRRARVKSTRARPTGEG